MSDSLDYRRRLYAGYRTDHGWDAGFDDCGPPSLIAVAWRD